MSKSRNSAGNSGHHHLSARNGDRLYTLEVVLAEGPVSEEFLEQNPDVSRTIQIRGDQTLQDLHEAILAAFDRADDQFYSFYMGAGRNRDGKELLPASTISSLHLRVGRRLRYHFDPDDDWTHDIKVRAVGDSVPGEKYPKVTARLGASPAQYVDGPGPHPIPPPPAGGGQGGGGLPGAAADVSLLIGEMHLKEGEYMKAIEAFTRAIEADPKASDEYEGRARAYRALAARDERRARELRAAARAAPVEVGGAS